ncbi:MAG: PH domain-containing protein [Isosphaeraceae bacterium]
MSVILGRLTRLSLDRWEWERRMDEMPEEVIRRELGPSEKLKWSGQPRQGLVLRAADAFLIPFSIMWGGFAIFWETMVIIQGAPFFFALWGIPFVLVGLYLMIGRFWVDARQRAAMAYGVTSERVVIVSGMRSRTVKSLDLSTLSEVTLTERSDGSGTITFGPLPFLPGTRAEAGWQGFGQPLVPCFDLPGNAREVYEIILKARQAAKQHV